MSKEAMKLALQALEAAQQTKVASLDLVTSEAPEISATREVLKTRLSEAMHNEQVFRLMAEEALRCALEQPAQQEPVATLYGSLPVYDKPAQQDIPDLIAGALGVSRGTAYDMMREALAEQPAQEPVGYWQGKFSEDGGATLCRVPQVAFLGRHTYPNIALYDRPQPPAQPLTDEQKDDMAGARFSSYWNRRAAKALIEDVEAALGITKGST